MTDPLRPGSMMITGFVAVAMLPVIAQYPTKGGADRPSNTNESPSCDQLGEVFAANPLDDTLMVKGDRYDSMDTIRFSGTTKIVRLTAEPEVGGTFDPKNIQMGDRVCVQLEKSAQKAAARILLMTRSDIQTQQKEVLSVLQHNSAYGTITSLNAGNRTIEIAETLKDGTAKSLTVHTSSPVMVRRYLPNANVAADGIASNWERLHPGDPIYVAGQRSTTSASIHADVILLGGVRSILGTVISIDALQEVLDLQDLSSDLLIAAHIRPDALFRISPFGSAVSGEAGDSSASDASLNIHPISFSDLQKGDTTMVLGRISDRTGEISGLMAVTGFGSFGLHRRRPDAPTFWFLDPLQRVR
jgi:hypothetical protein